MKPRSENCLQSTPSIRSSGFVLVSVLWFSLLITSLILVFATANKLFLTSARNHMWNAKAEFIADGLIRLVAFELTNQAPTHFRSLKHNGSWYLCRQGAAATVAIYVQDHNGLVNINTASPQLLKRLFRGLGYSENQAFELTDRVLDFRDPDDTPRKFGAERPQYNEAGLSPGPLNKPLSWKEQLAGVLGVSSTIYRRMSPWITVRSTSQNIDQTKSPDFLRQLLVDFEPRSRPDTIITNNATSHAFDIKVIVNIDQKGKFQRDTTISINSSQDQSIQFLSWKRSYQRVGSSLTSSINKTMKACPFNQKFF